MLVSQAVRLQVAPTVFGDGFNRAGLLAGSMLDVGGVVWQNLAGSAATTYSSGGGYVSGSGTTTSIHGFSVGRGTYRLRVTQPGTSSLGGDCVYFRVKDGSNWWRLRVNGNQVTTPGGTYAIQEHRTQGAISYRFEAPPGCHSGHSHAYAGYGPWVPITSEAPPIPNPGTLSHQHDTCVFHHHGVESIIYLMTNDFRTRYETYPPSSSPMHELILEKNVAGTVSKVATFTNLGHTPPASWGVDVTPNQIRVIQNETVKGTYNDSTLNSEFKVGIGRGPSTVYTSSRINSFEVE